MLCTLKKLYNLFCDMELQPAKPLHKLCAFKLRGPCIKCRNGRIRYFRLYYDLSNPQIKFNQHANIFLPGEERIKLQ